MEIEYFYSFFSWVGLIYLIRLCILIIYEIMFAFKVHLFPIFISTSDLTKYGSWAVVLGAADDVVASYAEELASKRLNIILVSRSRNQISHTAELIEKKHKVNVRCIAVDTRDEKQVNEFGKQIEKLDIGILVCGVDNRAERRGQFFKSSADELWGTIDNNMTSIAMIMSFVLPGMVQRRRGKIINFSSLFALDPQPNTTAHESATKAFSLCLSRACQFELAPQGVEVQTLTPATILSNPAHPFLFNYPSAKDYARSAVSLIDKCNLTTGHWSHGILQFFKYNLPKSLWKMIEDAGSAHCKITD